MASPTEVTASKNVGEGTPKRVVSINEQPVTPTSNVPSFGESSPSTRSSRKRTNEEAWSQAQDPPLSSPTRTQRLSVRLTGATDQTKLKHTFSQPGPLETTSGIDLPQTFVSQMADGKPTEKTEVKIRDSVNPTTFMQLMEKYKLELEKDYKTYEDELRQTGKGEPLASMDWDELQTRYDEALKPVAQTEDELFKEFAQRFMHFQVWMQVSRDRESERAFKRLCTRVAYVKNSEDRLSERQAHYDKVLNAFQNAMSLLGGF